MLGHDVYDDQISRQTAFQVIRLPWQGAIWSPDICDDHMPWQTGLQVMLFVMYINIWQTVAVEFVRYRVCASLDSEMCEVLESRSLHDRGVGNPAGCQEAEIKEPLINVVAQFKCSSCYLAFWVYVWAATCQWLWDSSGPCPVSFHHKAGHHHLTGIALSRAQITS